jgi:hypothetical protein
VANYKLTMLGLITEMLTNVQDILTDKFTLQQLSNNDDDDSNSIGSRSKSPSTYFFSFSLWQNKLERLPLSKFI